MTTISRNFKNMLALRQLMKHKRPAKEARSIMFVVENIHERGGVESRLLSFAGELTRHNIQPIFVTQSVDNPEFMNYPTIILNFNADNITHCINRIGRYFRTKTIEIQVTWEGSFHDFDITKVERRFRTGVMIHSNVPGIDYSTFNKFDYRLLVKPTMTNIDFSKFINHTIIPNAIEIPKEKHWEYSGQKKGLIFSRLALDKTKGLINVIKFLQKHNLDFEIVGIVENPDAVELLVKETSISSSQIKPMNVSGMAYMSAHLDDYLFVAGVGIVLLEAGALGFPCLIASELNPEKCTWLTQRSLKNNIYPNLTYNIESPERDAHLLHKFNTEELARLNLINVITDDYSIENRINQYIPIAIEESF